MFEVTIYYTSKGYHEAAGEYHLYDSSTKEFPTLDKALKFVGTEYYYNKTRHKIQSPDDTGHVGWVYCYKEIEYERSEKPYSYLCRDEVFIKKVTKEYIAF